MLILIFQSAKDEDVLAFADEQSEAKLPSEFSPWRKCGAANIDVATARQAGGWVNEALAAVQSQGHYVARASMLGTPASEEGDRTIN